MPLPVNINTRTLLIIAGLALPVIVLGVLTMHGQKEEVQQNVAPPTANAIENAKRAIEAEKAQHRARLAEVQGMTDAQWPQDLKKHGRHAATREQAIDNQKKALAGLDKMTPQQWLVQHQRQWQQWQTIPTSPLPALNR